MPNRIREILRVQYIGAIVIGYLTAVSIMGAVAVVIAPLSFKLLNGNHSYRSVFGSDTPVFDWNALVVSIVKIALQLGVAYLLVRWLYPSQDPDETGISEGSDDAVA